MSKRVPRLQFTDEELKAPKVKKAAKKADKAVDKLEKAEKKIPKKIFHEDVDKPKPSSKLTSEVKKAEITAKNQQPIDVKTCTFCNVSHLFSLSCTILCSIISQLHRHKQQKFETRDHKFLHILQSILASYYRHFENLRTKHTT